MLRIYTFPFLSPDTLEVKKDAPICILKLPLGGRETLDHLGKAWVGVDRMQGAETFGSLAMA